jgi:hypothetical protein
LIDMSERDLIQSFGTRVEYPLVLMEYEVLKISLQGIVKQIANEKYKDRRDKLKAIRDELKQLIEAV